MTKEQEKQMKALRKLGYTGETLQVLRSIEKLASRYNEDACNYPLNETIKRKRDSRVLEKVRQLFGDALPFGFIYNGDPRGYALKIDSEVNPNHNLHTDWGNFGILIPDEL